MATARTAETGDVMSRGAERLRRALKKLGWSQNELERRLDTPVGLVNRWLNGHRRPGLRFALQLEKLTGVAPGSWHEPVNAKSKAAA